MLTFSRGRYYKHADFTTNMQIGNDYFLFKYHVMCKKKFQNSHYFIDINEKVCLLCAQ